MRTGNQDPTFERVGEYAYSIGAEVAEMFAEDGGKATQTVTQGITEAKRLQTKPGYNLNEEWHS